MFKWLIILLLSKVTITILSPFVFLYNLVNTNRREKYIQNVVLGLDQYGGSLMYGTINWTISGYTHYRTLEGRYVETYILFERLINLLFWDKEHCIKAYHWDLEHDAKNEIKE